MKAILFAILLSMGCFASALAQWVETAGPMGGDVRCFSRVGNCLFAGTAHGDILRSFDSAGSWTLLPNTFILPVTTINDLFTRGNLLFAATNSGAWFSGDLGITWTMIYS